MNDEYGLIFCWPQHDDTIAQIWAEPGGQKLLEEIVADPAAPGRARFIAAEVLFANDIGFLARVKDAARDAEIAKLQNAIRGQ